MRRKFPSLLSVGAFVLVLVVCWLLVKLPTPFSPEFTGRAIEAGTVAP